MEKKTVMSLILILAGGFSNLIDRIFRGYVVDFIDVNEIINFPMFNLADILIFTGCALFAIFLIFTGDVYGRKNNNS